MNEEEQRSIHNFYRIGIDAIEKIGFKQAVVSKSKAVREWCWSRDAIHLDSEEQEIDEI